MRPGTTRTIFNYIYYAACAALLYFNRKYYDIAVDYLRPTIGPYAEVIAMLAILALLIFLSFLNYAIANTAAALFGSVSGNQPLNYEKGNMQANIQRTARRLEKKRNYAGAAETWETLEAWDQAAQCYEKANAYGRAAANWERAGDIGHAVELYERDGSYELAAALCHNHGMQERSRRNFRLAAEKSIEGNQVAKAAQFYEKAADYARAGSIYETLQRPDEALRLQEKAGNVQKVIELAGKIQAGEVLRRGPDFVDLLRRCGELMARNGSPIEAARLLEASEDTIRAAEIYASAGKHAEAGELYLKANQLDQAVAAYAKAGDSPESADFYARVAMMRGDWATAGAKYEEAGKANQAIEAYKRVRDYAAAAKLYETQGRYMLAGEMYSSARMFPTAANCYAKAHDWRNAAECFEQAGDSSQAMEAFGQAGNNMRAGQIALTLEDYGRAVEYLQRVAPSSQDHKLASAFLGTAFYYQFRADMAREIFRKVMPQLEVTRESLPAFYAWCRLLEEDRSPEAVPLYHQILSVDLQYADVGERVAVFEKDVAQTQVNSRAGYQGTERGYNDSNQSLPGYAGGGGRVSTPTIHTRSNTEAMDSSLSSRHSIAAETQFGAEGRYLIQTEMHRHGTVVTYRAHDQHLDRTVILKTFPFSEPGESDTYNRFMNEARAASKLTHPNLLTIFDFNHSDDLFYIACEFIDGDDLQNLVRTRGPLSLQEAKNTLRQAVDGLEYAHALQMSHLDLRPSHLVQRAGTNNIKITDLGLAALLRQNYDSAFVTLDSQVTMAGNPTYMAPEQIQGLACDARADIYSMGLILFFLLTGRTPFEAKKITDPQEIARLQIQTSFLRPSTLRATLPAVVDEIFLRCTQKSPSARYQTIRELGADLESMQPSKVNYAG